MDPHLKIHSQLRTRPISTPSGAQRAAITGVRWILVGLVVLFLSGIRNVFFHWGIPLQVRNVALISGFLGSACITWGIYRYCRATDLWHLVVPNHKSKLLLWCLVLALLLVGGLLNGNQINDIGKELIIFWLIGVFLLMGTSDELWFALDRPLTIMFYLAALLVFVYSTTDGVISGDFGTEQIKAQLINVRNIDSLGYGLRPLMGTGTFLFVLGCVSPRHGLWKVLQVGALFVTFGSGVGLFAFRGAVFSITLVAAMVLLVRPFLEQRRRRTLTAALSVCGVVGLIAFAQSNAYRNIVNRITFETRDEPIFASRIDEASAMFEDLEWAILTGRGLGGAFDVTAVFGNRLGENWTTIHIGILMFALKGGVVLMVLFISFVAPGVVFRSKTWYQNPCNLTATLLFPNLVLNFCFNPFPLSVDAVFTYLPSMMVLARYGRSMHMRRVGIPMLGAGSVLGKHPG